MNRLIISLLFFAFSEINLCESQNVILNPISISKLDTTFLAIIANHVEEMKVKQLYNPLDTFIVLFINPRVQNSSGVPQKIIDSIYKNNVFPLKPGSNSYNIVVLTLPFGCQLFNSIKSYKHQYCTKLNNYFILIVSMLSIEFENVNGKLSIIVCTSEPCDKVCNDNIKKVTSYIHHDDEIIQTKFIDIWLRNRNLINHPRE